MLESVLTAVAEDEGWQGNLTDEERRKCLAWVERRLSDVLRREQEYVRCILPLLNQLMERETPDRGDVIKAVLRL